MRRLRIAVACAALASAPLAGEEAGQPTPSDSQSALAYLLAIANETILPSSTCHGLYGVEGEPKVKDLLAMELASLARGRNSISGRCTQAASAHCAISITHSNGEDVSSAKIMFTVKAGRAQRDSLHCVLSP